MTQYEYMTTGVCNDKRKCEFGAQGWRIVGIQSNDAAGKIGWEYVWERQLAPFVDQHWGEGKPL